MQMQHFIFLACSIFTQSAGFYSGQTQTSGQWGRYLSEHDASPWVGQDGAPHGPTECLGKAAETYRAVLGP
ncbi:hypothetical protein N7462_009990 [Penicillium macrosclerotiorum]|uniref:uncharacterized protein n=1 Tax=Penicillium macrosclerotiorum TaxID=303699 RepID=UPI0025494560|nr:uncharacterized protein N7462_009990 [Penicillium macrosclerotiorum]KAJ5668920.1 hypothetical protein N7462_009990 [Penicillium macrosclerotiorum]